MDNKSTIPYLAKNEYGVPTLYVEDKPFLILGGELHNSSASSLEYMEEEIWPYVRNQNINTILLSIAWEDLEPEEGRYDDTLLEGLLQQARREKIKLILLWFGLWKNGESYYVPGWVKEDTKRFVRAEYEHCSTSNTVSVFCKEAVEKDKKAYCHLMNFLKENDKEHTVIMVQVENEIGILGAPRDYSAKANEAFEQDVPMEVAAQYGVSGKWEDAFGERACEHFMAYHYAKAIEEIASAGKEIYPIPMYVNAWLEQHPLRAGVYPSGGPVAGMLPMWQLAAPSIDFCAPDIYLPDFRDVCESYCVNGNPLFIPETGRNSMSASNVFYVFGKLNGLGFAPFGIEDIFKKERNQMSENQLSALNIRKDAFYADETAPYLRKSYEILTQIWDKLIACRGTDQMTAFVKQSPNERGCIIPFEHFDLQLDYLESDAGKPGSGGIIFKEDSGFYIIGCNVHFTALPKLGKRAMMSIPRYEEGIFVNGQWKRGRILNGDEVYDMTLRDMPECKYVRVYEMIL